MSHVKLPDREAVAQLHGQEESMPFTAKVKADGRFFIGSIELLHDDEERMAHNLQPGKKYKGLVFDSMPTLTQYIEFNKCSLGEFESNELEDLPGNYKIIQY
jgi:hypothetical protein